MLNYKEKKNFEKGFVPGTLKDNLTPKQRKNHRKMVEDMTGRNLLELKHVLSEGVDMEKIEKFGTENIVKTLIKKAIETDGEHHKQWYLVQIALTLGVDIDDIDEDERGKPP
jgi:hypothetical protein